MHPTGCTNGVAAGAVEGIGCEVVLPGAAVLLSASAVVSTINPLSSVVVSSADVNAPIEVVVVAVVEDSALPLQRDATTYVVQPTQAFKSVGAPLL